TIVFSICTLGEWESQRRRTPGDVPTRSALGTTVMATDARSVVEEKARGLLRTLAGLSVSVGPLREAGVEGGRAWRSPVWRGGGGGEGRRVGRAAAAGERDAGAVPQGRAGGGAAGRAAADPQGGRAGAAGGPQAARGGDGGQGVGRPDGGRGAGQPAGQEGLPVARLATPEEDPQPVLIAPRTGPGIRPVGEV